MTITSSTKFDRSKQRELLELLYSRHPHQLEFHVDSQLLNITGWHAHELNRIYEHASILLSNILYLQQHELIESYYESQYANHANRDKISNIRKIQITAKGIDFLLSDGGLSAILGIRTIKIHNETIEKFAEIIQNSNLAPEEKRKISDLIKEKGTEAVIGKLVDIIASNDGTIISTILRLLIPHAS